MRLDAFDYRLPNSLIAQNPMEDRSASRLMVVDRAGGTREHAVFRDLPRWMEPGDVLVVNRSRVVPARLLMRRKTGGKVEVLFTRRTGERTFMALANPLRKIEAGDTLQHGRGAFALRVIGKPAGRELEFELVSPGALKEIFDRYGRVPLPPYIDRLDRPADRKWYQTVFAEEDGSVAAPTAGLHFTRPLLETLEKRGVHVCSVVLHVGLGTFLPLERDEVEKNTLHRESYAVSGRTLEAIAEAKRERRSVVAVGTTVARLLETVHREGLLDDFDAKRSYEGETDLFIYPGYEFQMVDRLITNFHLPRSSLLILVCAFLGVEKTLSCYEEAIRESYRFYSYGDAMFIR